MTVAQIHRAAEAGPLDDFEMEHFRALFTHVPPISNANFGVSRNR
jgi:hypothetical protein